jgi:hypothetical protein
VQKAAANRDGAVEDQSIGRGLADATEPESQEDASQSEL